MFKKIVVLYLILSFGFLMLSGCEKGDQSRIEALEKKVAELESTVNSLVEVNNPQMARAAMQDKVRQRFDRDRETYSDEEMRAIEKLYQIDKEKWGEDEVKDSLRKLIEKYPTSNRAGCGVLYLAQMTDGDEKEKYLKLAIEKYDDCFYGDGVQVGAYARAELVNYYDEIGKAELAAELKKELMVNYPDAIDHRGNPLLE